MFERVVVASGTSNRQTRALASSVVEKVKEAGGDIVSVEGEDAGEWVLVDCNEVVHIMQPAYRATTTWKKYGVASRCASSLPRQRRKSPQVEREERGLYSAR